MPSAPPTGAAHIHYYCFDDQGDLDRTAGVPQTAPFSNLIDHEMAPGSKVNDNGVLRANIVANFPPASTRYTLPMGADSDPTTVLNLTTIMLAERIAAKIIRSAPIPGPRTCGASVA